MMTGGSVLVGFRLMGLCMNVHVIHRGHVFAIGSVGINPFGSRKVGANFLLFVRCHDYLNSSSKISIPDCTLRCCTLIIGKANGTTMTTRGICDIITIYAGGSVGIEIRQVLRVGWVFTSC